MTQQVKITIVQTFLMDHQTQKQCICFHVMKKKMVYGLRYCMSPVLSSLRTNNGTRQTKNYEVCYNIKFTWFRLHLSGLNNDRLSVHLVNETEQPRGLQKKVYLRQRQVEGSVM